MDRLRILGADWKRGGTELLERLTVPAELRAERLQRMREALGADELLYLATCNRVEVIFSQGAERIVPARDLRRLAFASLTGRQPQIGEAEQSFRLWGGEGALEHLLLVASGLDSALLGEREIRGQLRDGFRQAQKLGLCGPRLDWAITQAVRVARHVDRDTALSDGRHSLAGIGVERVTRHVRANPGRVALIGVSPMTERCGLAFGASGIDCLVVNRSRERGLKLAEQLGAEFRSLAAFRAAPDLCAAVVTAVGGDEPVLAEPELILMRKAGGPPPLLVDFGVPPNIDPQAAQILNMPRLDMETISAAAESNRSKRQGEAAAAREYVDRALAELRRNLAERETSPVLAEINRRYRRTALDGAERLFRKELRHLDGEQRQAVEAFALNLAKRLAHVPILGLRALASQHGHEAVETFLDASDEGLAELLQRSECSEDSGSSSGDSSPGGSKPGASGQEIQMSGQRPGEGEAA